MRSTSRPRSRSRSIKKVVGAKPKNSIIVYSAEAGSVAQDGLFTPTLTKLITQRGKSLQQILMQVRSGVNQASNGAQLTGEYNQLFSDIYLNGEQETVVSENTSNAFSDFANGRLLMPIGGKWQAFPDTANGGATQCSINESFLPQGVLRCEYKLASNSQLGYRYAGVQGNLDSVNDVSSYKSIVVKIRGSNVKMTFGLNSKSVSDYAYHHSKIYTVANSWQTLIIPMDKLYQDDWGKKVKIDLTKIFAIELYVKSGVTNESGWFEIQSIELAK